jgi:hypothetical protein
MVRELTLPLLACCQLVGATTYTVNPAQSTSTIQLSLTDPGYGPTAALPNGNTGVWYTTDGTTQDITAGTQWTLSNTALATIGNGTLTAQAPGRGTVQAAYLEATPPGTSSSANESPRNLSASTQVTITAAPSAPAPPSGPSPTTPTISWSAPATIPYGAALRSTQLNATPNVAGTSAYTPAAGTVLKAGKQTLSATFTPSDSKRYSAATASVHLTVNQAAPTITWATPAPIAAGTALSATQLDATASVPGSFMYNPAAGAVLAAGTQQLTAVFPPTDTTDYSSTTAHAALTVTSPSNPPTNPAPPHASVCQTLPPNPSQTTLQNAITSCSSSGGGTVQLSAGTTSISSTLNLACGVIVSGPVVPLVNNQVTPTAEITGGSHQIYLFSMAGGCTSGNTGFGLEYLRLDGNATLTIDGNSYNGITIMYDTLTSLDPTSGTDIPSIYFTQGSGNVVQNVTIEYDTIGDSNSCNWLSSTSDDSCGEIEAWAQSSAQSRMVNFIVKYNVIRYLGEGIHFLPSTYVVGSPTNYCDNCDIEYNYFTNIHRYNIEFQSGTANHPLIESNNVFTNPRFNYYNSNAVSQPCCQFSNADGTYSWPANTPGVYTQNNLIFNTVASGLYFLWGYEGGGASGQYTNNLIQGNVCTGDTYTFGPNVPADVPNYGLAINYNTIQGPIMSAAPSGGGPTGLCGIHPANFDGYIVCECSVPGGEQPRPKSIVGNVEQATPTSVTSVAPTISPASGVQTFPLTVTLTDPGYTSSTTPVPLGNTGIWYTTDGSTPVPGSGTAKYLASGQTFQLDSAGTVKAVGMWGTPPQPTSYPSGYGFVPSAVKSAHYTSGVASQQRRPR